MPPGATYCPNCYTPVPTTGYGYGQPAAQYPGTGGRQPQTGYPKGNYTGYPSGAYGNKSYPAQKKGVKMISRILLTIGAVCCLVMIAGWFVSALKIAGISFSAEQIAAMKENETMRQFYLPYASVSESGIAISVFNLISFANSLVSSAGVNSINTMKEVTAGLQPLNIMMWIGIVSSVVAAALMLMPWFVKKKWTKYLGVTGLIPAVIGIIVFVILAIAAGSEQIGPTGLSFELQAGAYILLAAGVVSALCSIGPLFIKD